MVSAVLFRVLGNDDGFYLMSLFDNKENAVSPINKNLKICRLKPFSNILETYQKLDSPVQSYERQTIPCHSNAWHP